MSKQFSRQLPFGATVSGLGETAFRLWAPSQTAAFLEVEGFPPHRMTRADAGWFDALSECGTGAKYQFRLGTGEKVPDPASRAQEKDVHGQSVVVDPGAYRWQHPEWKGRPWHETVLYELHVGTYGGFGGVIEALAPLADLGVTAIELMPINDFPGRRNWGYDGVLPFAPDQAYGAPEDLKRLVDEAHGHGLMIFLDVVYNHFGPDGNFLPAYAPLFFRDDIKTPWGPAIDFRQPAVRRFFAENALYWLLEYRFDGLRFDAVHAIADPEWLNELAMEIRTTVEPGRHVHLVLEHEGNVADHLRRGFDAQWNDDAHHAVHVLLTGETEGYYKDYSQDPSRQLARCLSEGFAYQGDPSVIRHGEARGTPSADLLPTSFVFFLQNHDQIGNRPFGDRLAAMVSSEVYEAAIALQLLCPQIPLIFMGEEGASSDPFLYFTDHHGELADAVREGRRREFAGFGVFADERRRAEIPDPNAQGTFERSRPSESATLGTKRKAFYRSLLTLRRSLIIPRLAGAVSVGADVLGTAAVVARWRMGDGAFLTIATNLGAMPVLLIPPSGDIIFSTPEALKDGSLRGPATIAFLERAP